MNQAPNYLQKDIRYRNSRASLLTIILLSVINVFSLIFTESYFLFSAYLPQLFVLSGMELTAESGESLFLIVAGVLAVIVVVPYLLCWIFSKKHVGWMIAALCMFSIDSVLFLFDFVLCLQMGDFTVLLDLAIRVWAIVSLALGIKYGLAAKNQAQAAPLDCEGIAVFAENGDYTPEYSGVQRPVTVSRQKTFMACLVPMAVYVNGKEVCKLKNGESQTVYAPEESFVLKAELVPAGGAQALPNATQGSITVDSGNAPITYDLRIKSGFSTATIEFLQR